MEPVASTWQKSHALGDSIIAGLKGQGIKILSSGSMAIDLTQTSYSSIPSIDLELGDKASDHSESRLRLNAAGIIAGLDAFFGL
jgi:N-acetylmuramoyl-L-alanine amidase